MEANAFLSDLPLSSITRAIIYMFYGLIIRLNCHVPKVRKALNKVPLSKNTIFKTVLNRINATISFGIQRIFWQGCFQQTFHLTFYPTIDGGHLQLYFAKRLNTTTFNEPVRGVF